MAYDRIAERLMGMDDAAWRKHANPMSGWTRLASLPLLTLALWSRVWLGVYAIGLIGLVLLWIWLNPRLFAEPSNTDNWMSQGVLGERVWLNRRVSPIAPHHARAAHILSGISAAGLVPYIWGLWHLSPWPTLLGLLVTMLAKLWFLDRMVWLLADASKTADQAGLQA